MFESCHCQNVTSNLKYFALHFNTTAIQLTFVLKFLDILVDIFHSGIKSWIFLEDL